MFNLKNKYESIHYYDERLSFPVMLLAKNKQESHIVINYLTKERTYGFNVIDFINWSDAHGIDIHILFPGINELLKILLKDPVRFICYLCIKKRIRTSKQYVTI